MSFVYQYLFVCGLNKAGMYYQLFALHGVVNYVCCLFVCFSSYLCLQGPFEINWIYRK